MFISASYCCGWDGSWSRCSVLTGTTSFTALMVSATSLIRSQFARLFTSSFRYTTRFTSMLFAYNFLSCSTKRSCSGSRCTEKLYSQSHSTEPANKQSCLKPWKIANSRRLSKARLQFEISLAQAGFPSI
ncbi:Hypothetical_protein [Hexamita inflata]|uniref:Hypothetical_protein n=1 Tax=Hexamita inflata TaxID=28002 RepID=A0AA86U2S0_9EUKA|nr:Hypothetical protein HINF_LOCUS27600 [Hexamita inflata]